MRFEGKQDSSTSESNIWDEMNSTQALGMSCAEQFDAVTKVFTMVDEFTEHLHTCTLIKIIKDGVNKPGAVGAA
eukprot:1273415-Rhodomonas_salina.2